MRLIHLSNGSSAKVDDEDFEMLSHWSWSLCGKYAARKVKRGGKTRGIYMHRQIMLPDPDQQVDHINGDRFDNRRRNLRLATSSQNNINRHDLRADKTSRYRGVTWYKRCGCWDMQIRSAGARRVHSYHQDEVDAALAYDVAALSLHGEFAKTNFLEPVCA